MRLPWSNVFSSSKNTPSNSPQKQQSPQQPQMRSSNNYYQNHPGSNQGTPNRHPQNMYYGQNQQHGHHQGVPVSSDLSPFNNNNNHHQGNHGGLLNHYPQKFLNTVNESGHPIHHIPHHSTNHHTYLKSSSSTKNSASAGSGTTKTSTGSGGCGSSSSEEQMGHIYQTPQKSHSNNPGNYQGNNNNLGIQGQPMYHNKNQVQQHQQSASSSNQQQHNQRRPIQSFHHPDRFPRYFPQVSPSDPPGYDPTNVRGLFIDEENYLPDPVPHLAPKSKKMALGSITFSAEQGKELGVPRKDNSFFLRVEKCDPRFCEELNFQVEKTVGMKMPEVLDKSEYWPEDALFNYCKRF